MAKPRLDSRFYTETYHLFGAMEKVVAQVQGDPDSVKQTVRMLPQRLKKAVAFRDVLMGLWRYDFGDPYTTQDDKQFLFGTDQCPQVLWLYQCVQLMQDVLSDGQLLLFLERLGDPSKHLEALIECSPLLVLREHTDAKYEVPGYGEKRVDFHIAPKLGPPLLIDAKCRIRELIRKVPLNAEPDPTGLFQDLPGKFNIQDPKVCTQGGWIHTVVAYHESKLKTEFESTDSSRLHFVILACWNEKAYVLARSPDIKDRVRQVFDLPQDDTIVLKDAPGTINLETYFKDIYDPMVDHLTVVVKILEDRFPKPEFVSMHGAKGWRYPEFTLEHMCILRSVRILSAFNAIKILLSRGFVQEIAVLLRTVDEFQEDIIFLIENYPAKELTPAQKKFMDEYGKEEYINPLHPFKTKTERNPPSRKQIKAAVSRFLTPVVNPSDSKRTSHIATDCLSGYVHGTYPHIMDIYGGPPPHSKFQVTGMLGTPQMHTFMKTVAMYLQRTIPVFAFLCRTFGLEKQFQELYQMKNWSVRALQSLGIETEQTPFQILNKIKKGKGKK